MSGTQRKTPETSYANFSRAGALAVLVGFVAAVNWCMLHDDRAGHFDFRTVRDVTDDTDLYQAVASRVHRGEGYYQAAGAELASRGYAVDSVFHWRMPLYAWIFGKPPSPRWGQALLAACGAVALAAASMAAGRECGNAMRLPVLAALLGSYLWVLFPGKEYNMEIWSGMFILISCVSYYNGRPGWGVAAGAVGLLLRELALPYCLAACLVSVGRRRAKEVFCWLLIFSAWTCLFYFHTRSASGAVAGKSGLHGLRWVAFGGTPFVLVTCRINFLLTVCPAWCVSLYLPSSLLGLAGWRSESALTLKLAAATYVLCFAVAGNGGNYYWGWLDMPLLVLGAARAPASLRDLLIVVTAGGNRADPRTALSATTRAAAVGKKSRLVIDISKGGGGKVDQADDALKPVLNYIGLS